MKRVGIDFHVVDGIYQGSRSHVLEIFSRVFRICPDIEFFLFLARVDELREKSPVFSLPNVRLVRMPQANPIMRLSIQLPIFQMKYELDILHTQYISPIPSFCKTVITLHDILVKSHPQYFKPMFRLRSQLLMKASADRATHIFTVSEYSKNEISSRYDLPPEKITVIHNGVDRERFHPGTDGIDVVEGKGLTVGNYILTVGRLEPRKNFITLIDAYAQLDTNMPLVIIGHRHFGYQQVKTRISEQGLSDRVFHFENIPDAHLASFYRHARLFVYPTWIEGFGIPIIEAMASGIPVISSNTTSLPEIAGSTCLLIEPGDVQGMRCAMANDELALELSKQGLARSEYFGWDKTAEKVKYVYETILNE